MVLWVMLTATGQPSLIASPDGGPARGQPSVDSATNAHESHSQVTVAPPSPLRTSRSLAWYARTVSTQSSCAARQPARSGQFRRTDRCGDGIALSRASTCSRPTVSTRPGRASFSSQASPFSRPSFGQRSLESTGFLGHHDTASCSSIKIASVIGPSSRLPSVTSTGTTCFHGARAPAGEVTANGTRLSL